MQRKGDVGGIVEKGKEGVRETEEMQRRNGEEGNRERKEEGSVGDRGMVEDNLWSGMNERDEPQVEKMRRG